MESNLKKALRVLLYDQFSVNPDLDENDSDETFVDNIIMALVEKNDDAGIHTCPFKNYQCEPYCGIECHKPTGIDITCDQYPEDVWRKFIGIEEREQNES